MKTLHFIGYSDDTFACEGKGIDVDHDNCASGDPIAMLVAGTGGSLIVIGQYCPGRAEGWLIGVSPHDPEQTDDRHIPEWPIRVERSDRSYSAMLVIEAPDDVTVTLLPEDDDE